MRLEIVLAGITEGRPQGTVGPVGGPRRPFTGWLDLLRAIEAHADELPSHEQTTEPREG